MCRIRSGCCARAANGIATAKPKIALINSRRLMLPPRLGTTRLSVKLARGFANVRFGSKADIGEGATDVRFTPESGHWNSVAECSLCAKSGHRHRPAVRFPLTAFHRETVWSVEIRSLV